MKLTKETIRKLIKETMTEMDMGVTSDNLGAASHMGGLEQEFAAVVEKMMSPYLSAGAMINIINKIDNSRSVTSMPAAMEETKVNNRRKK